MRRTVVLFASLALVLLPLIASAAAAADEESAAYLGVRAQKLTPLLADAIGLEKAAGVLVADVTAGSPAENAGFARGDVLLTWNGETISSPRSLIRLVRDSEPGDAVNIECVRSGDRKKVEVRLGERENRKEREEKSRQRRRAGEIRRSGARLGVEARDLVADLARYFDVPAGSGALVISVVEKGPADEAGIRPGDVIVRVEDEKVRSTADLAAALSAREPGDTAEVELVREGKKRTFAVELGARFSPFDRLRDLRVPEPNWSRFRRMDDRLEREMDRLKDEMEKLRRKIEEMKEG